MTSSFAPLAATCAPALPVQQLVIGKPVGEVVALIPRLFNLCKGAQEAAVKLALGVDLGATATADLGAEFARDHLLRLGLILPKSLGLDPLPVGQGAEGLMPADMPADWDAFSAWMESGQGFAPVFAALNEAFEAGEAVAVLPTPTDDDFFEAGAYENSTAIRHIQKPLMQIMEEKFGRGPLWRATARLLDLQDCLSGDLPAPRLIGDGAALVPASRGVYAVRATAKDGYVTQFSRVTPTDHLMASGGIMEKTLENLPASKHHLAAVVLDTLDPCVPVNLSGGAADA
ncbi:hydrogenase expression/formation protein HupK [Celeribacter litoreus]|uniref:hydrogenase expression/formation protein HupK n=1 Tax=Celeribacter litoreus TaxID=2876714 RepID=UPI001CCB6077|nr:hydrogenase expression/formation protein HupK [Celeribacter litoreus]MCA0043218.1 hydrogenase expression/formation protein HupK [Celeribacter litoreus]